MGHNTATMEMFWRNHKTSADVLAMSIEEVMEFLMRHAATSVVRRK